MEEWDHYTRFSETSAESNLSESEERARMQCSGSVFSILREAGLHWSAHFGGHAGSPLSCVGSDKHWHHTSGQMLERLTDRCLLRERVLDASTRKSRRSK
jgi:hypothetical protein